MLVALLLGQRGQTAHLLDIRNMTLTQSSAKFRKNVVKQTRPGIHQGEIFPPAYALDRRQCVVTVLNEYIAHTADLRKKQWLFISITKNNLFIFAPCLPHLFHHLYWHQTGITHQSLGSRPTLAQGHLGLVFGTAFHCLSVQPRQLLPSGGISKLIFWNSPPPPPVDTGAPTACWCYAIASSPSLLNTDLAVVPLRLATPGILAVLVDWLNKSHTPVFKDTVARWIKLCWLRRASISSYSPCTVQDQPLPVPQIVSRYLWSPFWLLQDGWEYPLSPNTITNQSVLNLSLLTVFQNTAIIDALITCQRLGC